MIEIGKYNELTILRHTSVGLYLGDEEGEDVLLPNKYCPEEYEIDDKIKVFVYLDYEERKVATNIIPKIHLGEFALLQVADVSAVGAFMDWGLEKDLLVPFKEQRAKMEEGRWYVVYMDVDDETERLYATNKLERRLQNHELSVAVGDEVDLMVYHKSELGYSVIIKGEHKGLVFNSDVHKELNIGEKLKGYIKNIREDNKVDVTLQAVGYDNFNDSNVGLVYNTLVENNGELALTDKSSPEAISLQFGISKKAFKKALGSLYKQRKVSIEASGIKLV